MHFLFSIWITWMLCTIIGAPDEFELAENVKTLSQLECSAL